MMIDKLCGFAKEKSKICCNAPVNLPTMFVEDGGAKVSHWNQLGLTYLPK